MGNESIHQYGAVALGIILSALVAAGIGLYHRVERVSERIHHKDYLEEKFENIEERIERLEEEGRGRAIPFPSGLQSRME